MLEQTRLTHSADASGLRAKRGLESVSALADLPDLLLVERARARDTRAFETLMRRYNRRLYRIARSILNNGETAEEAVRAAHVRAFANLDRYEPAGKFGSWLARLAFNEAVTLRKQAAIPNAITAASLRPASASAHGSTAESYRADDSGSATDGSDASGSVAGDDAENSAAARENMERAIDGLPEVFRTVLVLRVIEELTGVEVAVCLGLNETTVRTRLYRAHQRLKADMARQLRAEPSGIFALTPDRGDRIVSQVFARMHNGAQTETR